MGTIYQLNPHFYRASIRGSGKLIAIMPLDFMHSHYQDYFKLFRKLNLKLIHIACLDGNSGSNLNVHMLKTLASEMFAWQKTKT
jgi:hypothetical protein